MITSKHDVVRCIDAPCVEFMTNVALPRNLQMFFLWQNCVLLQNLQAVRIRSNFVQHQCTLRFSADVSFILDKTRAKKSNYLSVELQ
jgi:hypothetical protein